MTSPASISSTTESEPPEACVEDSAQRDGEHNRERGPSPRKVAMDYLARREHSLAELRAKLVSKDFDAREAEATVSRLASQGLVSDARFAAAFTAARARKGQGPVRLRHELEQREVAAELIDTALVSAEVNWAELARSVREKKYGAALPHGFRDRAKQMKFLQYRGFTTEQIQGAFGDDKL